VGARTDEWGIQYLLLMKVTAESAKESREGN
jgi:hypothetical protein